MSTVGFIPSPVWTAIGWTMWHLLWVGALIGLVAALLRRALPVANSELRYGAALGCLLMLALSPVLIFANIYKPAIAERFALEPASAGLPLRVLPRTDSIPENSSTPSVSTFAWKRFAFPLASLHLESLVSILPWIWLCGSTLTLFTLATGLIAVEQLRRSSRRSGSDDMRERCHALANSLGLAQRVTVGVCDRLATPVLLGIIRPMILLPPAALCGWSAKQLEMILLHELAHLRRRDNLVNLLQRVVESLLFFHPVVWWISGWVRLERELCCDRFVVNRLGQPVAYAEMLVMFSSARLPNYPAALAMADRRVMIRIRRLLNLEDRSMKPTMPEGLGMLSAVVVGTSLILSSQGGQTKPVDDANVATPSIPAIDVDDRNEIPKIEATPPAQRLSARDGDSAPQSSRDPQTPATRIPRNHRSISIFARDSRRLEIRELPTSPDGTKTYLCRGGIKIVCRSANSGVMSLEADEAVIKRLKRKDEKPAAVAPNGETWFEEADVPMEVHLKGNVVVRQEGTWGKGDIRTVRAPELDYNFVTERLVAPPAKPEVSPSNLRTKANSPEDKDSRIREVPGADEHSISLSPRDARPIVITETPRELDGTVKYLCKGGIKVVTKLAASGTVSIDADEVVIKRQCRFGRGEAVEGTNGGTWVEDDELPTNIHAAHNVVIKCGSENGRNEADRCIIHAEQVDYDLGAGRLIAKKVVVSGPQQKVIAESLEILTRKLAP